MVVDEAVHDGIRALLGSYALGALDHEERAAVEVHMTYCKDCRRTAITRLESAGLLVDEPLAHSPELWDSIVERAAVRRQS